MFFFASHTVATQVFSIGYKDVQLPIGSMYVIYTYIYQNKSTIHVGKYTVRPMDPMGQKPPFFHISRLRFRKNMSQSQAFALVLSAPQVWRRILGQWNGSRWVII